MDAADYSGQCVVRYDTHGPKIEQADPKIRIARELLEQAGPHVTVTTYVALPGGVTYRIDGTASDGTLLASRVDGAED